jgi:hypothetical protein
VLLPKYVAVTLCRPRKAPCGWNALSAFWPAAICAALSQRREKPIVLLAHSFGLAPGADLSEIEFVAARNREGDFETLSIVPVIEGSETIAAGVCGRQGAYPDSRGGDLNRPDVVVRANGERTRREFDDVRQVRMNVAIVAPAKPELAERLVDDSLLRISLRHEVDI